MNFMPRKDAADSCDYASYQVFILPFAFPLQPLDSAGRSARSVEPEQLCVPTLCMQPDPQSLVSFAVLPPEIKLLVFSFLDAKEWCRLSSVCKEWNRILADDQLWRPLCTSRSLLKPSLPFLQQSCKYIYLDYLRLVHPSATRRRADFEQWQMHQQWGNHLFTATFRTGAVCPYVSFVVWFLWLTMALFILFLSLRLDDIFIASWHIIFLPLYLFLGLCASLATFYFIAACFHTPDYIEWRRFRRHHSGQLSAAAFVPTQILWCLFSFALLVGAKLSGETTTWQAVWFPLWLLIVLQAWSVVCFRRAKRESSSHRTNRFFTTGGGPYNRRTNPITEAVMFLSGVILMNGFLVALHAPIYLKLTGVLTSSWGDALTTVWLTGVIVDVVLAGIGGVSLYRYLRATQGSSEGLRGLLRRHRNRFVGALMCLAIPTPLSLWIVWLIAKINGSSTHTGSTPNESDVERSWISVFAPMYCVLLITAIGLLSMRYSRRCYTSYV